MTESTEAAGARWAETGRLAWAFGAAALALAAARVHAALSSTATLGTDSSVFLAMASLSPLDSRLWAGPRPPLVPLVYGLAGGDPPTIAAVQVAVAIVCWLALAATAADCVRHAGWRLVAFAGIGLFGLSSEIVLWDEVLLSESLSVSLLALLVATALAVTLRPIPTRAVAFAVAAGCWGLVRDTNPPLLLVIGAALLVSAAAPLGSRRAMRTALGAFLVAVFLVAAASIERSASGGQADENPDLSARWVYPLLNVYGRRLLVEPTAIARLAESGMPLSSALAARAGKFAGSDDGAFYSDPGLAPFRVWFAEHGRRSYVYLLASRPLRTVLNPLADLPRILDSTATYIYAPPGLGPVLPSRLAAFVYPRGRALVAWAAAAALGLVVLLAAAPVERTALVPATLLLLVPAHLFLVWHGDAMEVDRHAVALNVQLRLGLWLTLLFAVDRILRPAGPETRAPHVRRR